MRTHRLVPGAPRRPLCQAFDGVFADCLQHPEARLVANCTLSPQQACAQERFNAVDHIELEPGGDCFCAVDREAGDEDAEAGDECLLLRLEQLVAPLLTARSVRCRSPSQSVSTVKKSQASIDAVAVEVPAP